MGYPFSEFELLPVPIDNARMEKLEVVVYELLHIIQNSRRYDVLKDSFKKLRQLDKERNSFLESRPNQVLTSDEIEKLLKIGFKFSDIMYSSIITDIDQMEYEKTFIDKLIEQLE